MGSDDMYERVSLGYKWTRERERKRLERLFHAWCTIAADSSYPLANYAAGYYAKRINRLR